MSHISDYETLPPDLRLERPRSEPLPAVTIDLRAMLAFLKASARIIAVCALIGAALGYVLSLGQTKLYQASSRVVYGEIKGGTQDQHATLETGAGDNILDAQIELLKSDAVLAGVDRELGLASDPRARARLVPAPSALSALLGLGGTAPVDLQAAHDLLNRNVKVERVGRTHLIEISYTSPDAQWSAKVANAFASAYVAQQMAVDADIARRQADWLSGQVADLKRQRDQKAAEIQSFRSQHGLAGPDGSSLVNAQLSDANNRLGAAQAEVDNLETRYRTMIEKSVTIDPLSISNPSAVLSALQQKYATAQQRYEQLKMRLGANHELVQRLGQELASLQKDMEREADRAMDMARDEVDQARGRLAALKTQIERLTQESLKADVYVTRLKEMQAQGDAIDQSLKASLARYQQSVQDQSYSVPRVQVVDRAEVPVTSISAPSSRFLLAGLGFGILAGLVLALSGRAFGRKEAARS